MKNRTLLMFFQIFSILILFPLISSADNYAVPFNDNQVGIIQLTHSSINEDIRADGDPIGFKDAMFAGADYLRFMQADVTEDNAGNGTDGVDESPDDPDDGGWDWILTYPADPLSHSVNPSPINIYGATGMGLVNTHNILFESPFIIAMTDAIEVMINNSSIRSANDIIMLMQSPSSLYFDEADDSAKAKFDARIATYGSATAFAETIRDVRAIDHGLPNGIIAWDIGLWVKAAALLADRFPSDPYDYGQAAIDMAEVIWQDSYNDNPGYFDIEDDKGYDPAQENVNYWWYNLGLFGLITAFYESGSHVDELDGLVTTLLESRNTDGFISFQYGGNDGDAGWQSTAYAVMALALVDYPAYTTEINHACYWTAATQHETGGWIYEDGEHLPEVGGENLTALSYVYIYSHDTALVDDDFASQDDVDLYNSSNGANYLFGFDAFSSIQDAVLSFTLNELDEGVILVMDGLYEDAIDIEDTDGDEFTLTFEIIGESQSGTIIMPASTNYWAVGGYNSRRAGIRIVSAHVEFSNLTADFDIIKGNNTAGFLYWNSSGAISNCTLQNMNYPDYLNGYTELTCYLRAPDFTDENRAHLDILNNTFLKTGRLGVVTHDFVDVLIEGNSFDKVEEDFGYALEIGSTSTGVIRNNTFQNYATWAATDQSVAAAILIENSFTQTVVDPIYKPVLIENNDISACQYGVYVGNGWENLAGNVDIDVVVRNNDMLDAWTSGSWASGGMVLTDEGKDLGSSVTATIDSNMIYNNDDYGIYIYTEGNGDISSHIRYNWLVENYKGIVVKDFGTPSTSSYNLDIHHNLMNNFLNAENDAAPGYWDDNVSTGNCWSDYDEETGGPYTIPGNAGSVDRYPNVYCGDCRPGDANNDGIINLLDITYLIAYKYMGGSAPVPYEICSGDPNTDCVVNLLDITNLIAGLYMGGSPPGNAFDWYMSCGFPIRLDISDGTPPSDISSASMETGKVIIISPFR